jgi:tRNA threonylcarbamoyladenosine modification (KEOPS) complex  Pcc1 subunit
LISVWIINLKGIRFYPYTVLQIVLTKFTVTIKLPKSVYADTIMAIKPELGKVSGRSKEWLEEDEENLYFYIQSPDTVSLKTSLNAFARLASLVERISKEVV